MFSSWISRWRGNCIICYGATLGSAIAPSFNVPIVFASALGSIGVFSGATNAPISAFMVYLELFGYSNGLFAMLVCIISVFISDRAGIYTSQLWNE